MATFLPIVPNWRNGVRDTYSFQTDIFASRDGSEQRRSNIEQPRRTMELGVILDRDRLRVFSDAMVKSKDGRVEIGDFSAKAAVLQIGVTNGTTSLNVKPLPAWAVAGKQCALLTGRVAQKVTISSVTALPDGFGTIVLTTPGVKGTVGAGAGLSPLLPAFVQPSTSLSLYTTMVATSSIKLDVEPGTVTRVADPLPFDGGPTGETTQVFDAAGLFYGRYVLLRKPNYLQRPTMAISNAFEKVDYNRGIVKTYHPVPMISRTLTATYMAVSNAEALALLDIFVRSRGRAGELYIPTWGSDFPPVVAVSGSTITVEGTDFYDTYNGDVAHKAFLIRNAAGDIKPCELHSMATSGGNTVITVDAAVGIAQADVVSISWMFVSRFAQDTLTIEWQTNGVANVNFSFVTLENLAAENSYGSNWILATGYWRDLGEWVDADVWTD